MKLPNPRRKRIILVTEREPLALAGARNRWGNSGAGYPWDCSRSALCPVKEGCLSRVLPALGLHLDVQWYRWPEPPPMARWMRQVESFPTCGMRCSEDFEAHWRKSNLWRDIKRPRNRCRGFELKVNATNSIELIIKGWDQKWRGYQGGEQRPDITEQIVATEYLQKRGLYFRCRCLTGMNPWLALLS